MKSALSERERAVVDTNIVISAFIREDRDNC